MEVGGKEGVTFRIIPKTCWMEINNDFIDALLAVPEDGTIWMERKEEGQTILLDTECSKGDGVKCVSNRKVQTSAPLFVH